MTTTTGGGMHLDRDFSEFIACCVARDARFLIVGGYALAAHGHPRFTKDLDVWIAADSANAGRLLDALADFGFGDIGLQEGDFTAPDAVIQLGYPPLRIDLLTSIDGVEFDACYSRRVVTPIDGVPVPFLHSEDLIRNKRASGRAQDLADVEALEG